MVTGSSAVNRANNPPRNPFKYLNTESIVNLLFISFVTISS
jgi:hypothetical protein